MEIEFRNVAGQRFETGLAAFLEPELAAGRRAVVLCGSRERLEALNLGLWTYDPASFLPHGSEGDGHAERQPVYLTLAEENPNAASLLVMIDDAEAAAPEAFEKCSILFDRNDPAVREAARARWRNCLAAGHTPVYWEFSAQGWQRNG